MYRRGNLSACTNHGHESPVLECSPTAIILYSGSCLPFSVQLSAGAKHMQRSST